MTREGEAYRLVLADEDGRAFPTSSFVGIEEAREAAEVVARDDALAPGQALVIQRFDGSRWADHEVFASQRPDVGDGGPKDSDWSTPGAVRVEGQGEGAYRRAMAEARAGRTPVLGDVALLSEKHREDLVNGEVERGRDGR